MTNAVISIKSTQKYEGDPQPAEITFITDGDYERTADGCAITYKEGELTGYQGVTTHLNIDAEKVSMWRSGGAGADMVFQKGVRHHALMQSPEGTISFCVVTKQLDRMPIDNGEVLYLDYNLEVNGNLISQNTMELKIEF